MVEDIDPHGGENPGDARGFVKAKSDGDQNEACHVCNDEDTICSPTPERCGKDNDQVDTKKGHESTDVGLCGDVLLEVSRNGPLVD